MIEVKIKLELVESLMAENASFQGTVLLGEIRDIMERFMVRGLIQGKNVSIRPAFEFAWRELVIEEPTSMSMSDYEDEMI